MEEIFDIEKYQRTVRTKNFIDHLGKKTITPDTTMEDLDYMHTCNVLHTIANTACKQTEGKPRVSLVPPALFEEVARVRTWAVYDNHPTEKNGKYTDPESWRNVPADDYADAIGRHYSAYLRDPKSTDPESGLSHMAHIACNAAFLLEMARGNNA